MRNLFVIAVSARWLDVISTGTATAFAGVTLLGRVISEFRPENPQVFYNTIDQVWTHLTAHLGGRGGQNGHARALMRVFNVTTIVFISSVVLPIFGIISMTSAVILGSGSLLCQVLLETREYRELPQGTEILVRKFLGFPLWQAKLQPRGRYSDLK